MKAVEDNRSGGLADRVWHAIMFWFLTLMGLVLFIPCVLVPVWVDGESIREHERVLAGRIDDLETQVDKNDMRINALLSDPLVNQRVIRREFNYSPEHERIFRWSVPDDMRLHRFSSDWGVGSASVDSNESIFGGVVLWLSRWLPRWPWRLLFAHTGNRHLLLLMAGGVLMSAFLLYGPAKQYD